MRRAYKNLVLIFLAVLCASCSNGSHEDDDGTFTLTVEKTGTGSGAVTSNPVGITCGNDCSELYKRGTIVTVLALPDPTSTFAGWSGACTGTGPCVVTVMGTNLSVTAAFTRETMCPDSRDPKVHYVADSDRNPAVCQTVRFLCVTGFTPFNNACGCGCIEP